MNVGDGIFTSTQDHEGVHAPSDEADHDDGLGARDLDQGGPRAEVAEEVSAHCACPMDDDAAAAVGRAEVDGSFDVWGEHRKEAVEIAVDAGGDEAFRDTPLRHHVHPGDDGAFRTEREASPVGQLATRRRRPPQGGSDGVEGEPKDVVEDEGHPLGGREALEDDEQGEADLVIEGDWSAGSIDGPGQIGATVSMTSDAPRVSLRARAEPIWSRQIRLVTTMSQPRTSRISVISASASRANASWVASSAAATSRNIE